MLNTQNPFMYDENIILIYLTQYAEGRKEKCTEHKKEMRPVIM